MWLRQTDVFQQDDSAVHCFCQLRLVKERRCRVQHLNGEKWLVDEAWMSHMEPCWTNIYFVNESC